MSDRWNRRWNRPRIVVRETDSYFEREQRAPEPEPVNPWIRNLFQPATFCILAACTLLPIATFAATVWRGFGAWVLIVVPLMMALVGFSTQRVVIKRLLSGTEATRFRLVELGVLFLLARLLSLADSTPPELAATVAGWSRNPLSFFDALTIVAFLLGAGAWWAGAVTARDLDAIRDPSLYLGETGPRLRLIRRYFAGGAVLMVAAALNRVNLLNVVTGAQARVTRPIVSALVYFFAGLVMLGQIRFARLVSLWRRDSVTVARDLNSTWVRYMLLLLVIAAAVAFALPTGYTVGLLDLVAYVIQWLLSLMVLIYLLVTWPLSWLAALLLGTQPPGPPEAMRRPPLQPPEAGPADGGPGAWWAVVRSILFWGVLIATVVYLVRSYIRDRPELRALVKQLRPVRWLRSLWGALRRWLAGLGKRAAALRQRLVARLQDVGERVVPGLTRRSATDPRDIVRQHYLTTLEVAEDTGVPRRRTQTPFEYEARLADHVEAEKPALTSLTQAFVESRYSDHAIGADAAAAQAANAARVQRKLKELDESATEETA